jgi:hypothetical protein
MTASFQALMRFDPAWKDERVKTARIDLRQRYVDCRKGAGAN